MKLITRIAFATLLTTGFSITAQAADVKAAPAPAQDPIVQHLKLTNDQVAKIKSLHQQLESNVQQISQQEINENQPSHFAVSGETFFIPQADLRFGNNGFQFAKHLIITKAGGPGDLRLHRG